MTQGEELSEEEQFEVEQLERFSGGGDNNAGVLVETRTGFSGRTYSHEPYVSGKIRVYTDKGNLLCEPSTLKLIGYID